MKIIIETDNRELDEKIRLKKIQKELRNTIMRFGYNCKEVDVTVDVRGPAECELNITYKHGYNKGFEAGQIRGAIEKHTTNERGDLND